jgi:molybdate transport system substrate-binding protein
VAGTQSPGLVSKGETELGIAQASEIMRNAGAQLVGTLPGDLGTMTRFSGGVGAESASAGAAKALIDFLAGQEAGPRSKAKGFEPGG